MASANTLAGAAATATVANTEYIEQLYQSWLADPASVGEHWSHFFNGFHFGLSSTRAGGGEAAGQSRVWSLVLAYRSQGHRMADVNPLDPPLSSYPDLELARFGFTEADLDREFDVTELHCPQNRMTLRAILTYLRETYCRTIGVEYMHIQDMAIQRWMQAEMETVRSQPGLPLGKRIGILRALNEAEMFENFVHARYPGQKRFSLEGGETLIAAMRFIAELAPEVGVKEIVIGMAHRGRLNVLTNILGKSYASIFSEFEGRMPEDSVYGDGDVKYHKGFSSVIKTAAGKELALALTANPSHLEAVNPVVEGRARAKQRQLGDSETRRSVVPLLIHGDAAFAGQGIVTETLNMSQLEGYRTGGTIHIIVNNQIGFTTTPDQGRSTVYCTDVAKMIEAPVLHVNGDDPEAVVYAAELSLRFRQQFARDIVIDIVCYRKHGHNEGDEPEFTQPAMYRKIKGRTPVRAAYTQKLMASGALSEQDEQKLRDEFQARLAAAHDEVKKSEGAVAHDDQHEIYWKGLLNPFSLDPVDTSVDHATLMTVARGLCTVPEGFKLNPKVARMLPKRLEAIRDKGVVDWGFAEGLSLGALLVEGTPVRLSGQDSQRGTFSHRHAVWQDMETNAPYKPHNNLQPGQAKFCVYNSLLSEAAVLGFDYGYSLSEPRMLVMWEAQFGDFANGAQVIIDQFITSSETKWNRSSGIVMLLPHGYEGQGPEHSNAYLERYLAACAGNNIQVANITTPANFFHALRRQVKRNFRRPLIVMSPKSLLRHPKCISPVEELISGGFEEVLDDPMAPRDAKRLVLCTGKVFYDLVDARAENAGEVAIVRLEQIYPLHEEKLRKIVARYPKVKEICWVQEEPANRGAWPHLFPVFLEFFPKTRVRYIGRDAAASPATGLLAKHVAKQREIVTTALTVGA